MSNETTTEAPVRRASIAGPIVRPTLAGKTHFLRVESLDPSEAARSIRTLCNTDRNNAPVLTMPGVQVTCKRCLKLNELNNNPVPVEASEV